MWPPCTAPAQVRVWPPFTAPGNTLHCTSLAMYSPLPAIMPHLPYPIIWCQSPFCHGFNVQYSLPSLGKWCGELHFMITCPIQPQVGGVGISLIGVYITVKNVVYQNHGNRRLLLPWGVQLHHIFYSVVHNILL